MNLEIGMYVRTINGKIWIITSQKAISGHKKDIINASYNIIDLIEENDFVNHSRVVCIGISTDLKGTHKYLVLEKGNYCPNGNIKSIVTKEQFESMEYKVKE